MTTTWILVADGAKARLFSLVEGQRALAEIEDFWNPQGRTHGREFSSERPQRTHDRLGNSRHAIEPHTSPREKSDETFARELHAALEQGRVEHRYDKLMLMAPPHFLGTLNSVIGKQVRAQIQAEVPKDLTEADVEAIRAHLPEDLQERAPGRH